MPILPRRSICTNLRDWYRPLTHSSWMLSAKIATKFRLFSHTPRLPFNANTAATCFAPPLVAAPSWSSVAHGEERVTESDLQSDWCCLDNAYCQERHWHRWSKGEAGVDLREARAARTPRLDNCCLGGGRARIEFANTVSRLGVSRSWKINHPPETWARQRQRCSKTAGNVNRVVARLGSRIRMAACISESNSHSALFLTTVN